MKRLMVFCYAPYPNEEWEALFTHAADIAFAVINVNSGVGDELDPVYVAMVKRLQAAGVRCLGYSSTRYGARPLDEVRREIDLWFTRYSVDGIFADEMEHETGQSLPYYRRIKSACGTSILVTNPGTVPDSAYADLDAIIVTAETDQQTYLSKAFPPWTTTIGGRAVAHIVFSVIDAAKVLAKIDANHADYFYLCTTVPKPGASGPEFTITDTLWPPAESPAPTPVPAPPATARMLSTCTDLQLLEEMGRRLAR